MARPKYLLAVPLLAAGIWLPAMKAPLAPLDAGAIGMTHEGYSEKVIKIHQGDTITFQNDSRWIHIIGPGDNGVLSTDPKTKTMSMADMPNMGIDPRTVVTENGRYTTAPWNTIGTFYITCTVHPEMNATVVVTD